MCLIRITKRYSSNRVSKVVSGVEDKPEVWYKVVRKYALKSPSDIEYETPYRSVYIKLGEWNSDTTVCHRIHWSKPCGSTIQSMLSGEYEAGYHFYNLKGAREMKATGHGAGRTWAILECIVTKITAKGIDQWGNACVAKEFRAMREVE